MVGIYKITSPTNKVYIGQSKNIVKRWKRYKSDLCKYQYKIFHSLKKHGWEAHKFEMIHELPSDITQKILNNYEILYIDLYKSCNIELLNLTNGGSGDTYGKKKLKMTEENKEILRQRMLGNKCSLGTKNALGTKRTEEHKKVRRELWEKGVYACNCVPIICNETQEKFNSMIECVKSLFPNNSSKQNITACQSIGLTLKGKRKKKDWKGYTFSYIN